MTEPIFKDEHVALYVGRHEDLLPEILGGGHVDCAIADPPYAETSLTWDRWPDGWPELIASFTSSLWCFGSMRMFLDRRDEFAGWRLSQDVVWEKHNGSGFHADRFRRVHEHVVHWYRGPWSAVHHDAQVTMDASARSVRSKRRPAHTGDIDRTPYVTEEGGPRLRTSVLKVRSMHGSAIHPTEKPVGLLDPLIRYACPPGGTVLDPFAGSASTLVAARAAGRRAIGIEERRDHAEAAARRLDQGDLFSEVGA